MDTKTIRHEEIRFCRRWIREAKATIEINQRHHGSRPTEDAQDQNYLNTARENLNRLLNRS